MKNKSFLFSILVIAFVVRLLYLNVNLLNNQRGIRSIQQDNYVNYAKAIRENTLNSPSFLRTDTRLFPGYPIAINSLTFIISSEIVSGIIISIVSSLFSIWIFWLITKDKLSTSIFTIFPPVWITQSTKIANEPLVTFLMLLSIFMYFKKKYIFTGITLGLAVNVRLIAICLLPAFLLTSLSANKRTTSIRILIGFTSSALLLLPYNYFYFGKENIFLQFIIYPQVGIGAIGILQLMQDLVRTLDWKQYRIFFSGVFYIFISMISTLSLFVIRKKSIHDFVFFYWLLFSLFFILLYGPTPILEDFSRFTVPVSPAIVLGITFFLKRIKILKPLMSLFNTKI